MSLAATPAAARQSVRISGAWALGRLRCSGFGEGLRTLRGWGAAGSGCRIGRAADSRRGAGAVCRCRGFGASSGSMAASSSRPGGCWTSSDGAAGAGEGTAAGARPGLDGRGRAGTDTHPVVISPAARIRGTTARRMFMGFTVPDPTAGSCWRRATATETSDNVPGQGPWSCSRVGGNRPVSPCRGGGSGSLVCHATNDDHGDGGGGSGSARYLGCEHGAGIGFGGCLVGGRERVQQLRLSPDEYGQPADGAGDSVCLARPAGAGGCDVRGQAVGGLVPGGAVGPVT